MIGKVSSLLTQGVSSVVTPFHPFSGAVDIIVVQQQDGSFKSTPWYVQFGKFQGVLKGAEKLVKIEVNGLEANFHMHLDNAGEACFIKEVICDKESEINGGLKDSDSLEGRKEDKKNDYGDEGDGRIDNDASTHESSKFGEFGDDELQMLDERVTLGMDRLERTESNITRFYEFQDEHSSLDGSVDLSEYDSSQYDNLDNVEQVLESQTSSEVVLMSVDGHVLTAPITSADENGENMQLNTPQFHLDPGEGTDFCEGNTKFNTSEAAWAAEYLTDLNTSPPGVDSPDVCDKDSDNNVSGHQLELHAEDSQHCHEVPEIENKANEESNGHTNTGKENTYAGLRRDDVYKSCLELSELAMQNGDVSHQEMGPSSDNNEIAEILEGESLISPKAIIDHGDVGFGKSSNGDRIPLFTSDTLASSPSSDLQVELDTLEEDALISDQSCSNSTIIQSDCHDKKPEEQTEVQLAAERVQSSLQVLVPETECTKRENMELQKATFTEDIADLGLEISLCRKLLHAGMGSSAAAEAFDANRISEEEFKLNAASIIKNENLVVRIRQKYLPWEKAAPIVLGIAAYGLDIPVEYNNAIPVEDMEMLKAKEDDSGISHTPSGRRWSLWSISFRRSKTLEHTTSNSSNEKVYVDSESGSQDQRAESTPTSVGCESPHKQLVRTNVPTSDQIASLNLKEGKNTVTFIFSTRYLRVQKVEAHIYLWKWNARIVISDVDGTITKSDVLGQVMPLVGKDWTHSGIARFFSAIKENGYQLLFLSARAIVQAYLTRSFLFNLKQDGKTLPDGPVVISPDGLFPSLFREVIRRAPHEFKIACLEDIKALFPPDYNPFYAGFGNRDTDELSYLKIGIPKGKIFIINPKGEVAVNRHIDVKSYTSLHTLVNDMFPPTSLVEQEGYNSWNYWRLPFPDIGDL